MVVDESDSSYTAEYTTYKAGDSTLYATLLVGGGVQATYYDNRCAWLDSEYDVLKRDTDACSWCNVVLRVLLVPARFGVGGGGFTVDLSGCRLSA